MAKRITELWGYFAVDNEGQERLVIEEIDNVAWPYLGSDADQLPAMNERAEAVAKDQNVTIKLRRFLAVGNDEVIG